MASRKTAGAAKSKDKKRHQVFVAYSYLLYPKDDYRNPFKEIEKSYDVTFIFADEKITNMHIMAKIESFIRSSDFSIFDISGWNPNVTLELGFAMALNDQWYIALDPTKTGVQDVPSDLRGLDRVQYGSYTELGQKIQAILAQRYPKRRHETIDSYLATQRSELLNLLREDPGLTVTSIAQVLGVEVQVAQLVVRPLVDEGVLSTEGKRKATTYFIAASRPTRRQSSRPPPAVMEELQRDPKRPERTFRSIPPDVELNGKEDAVLSLLRRRRTGLHLDEIGAVCFRTEPAEKANSWARNSMRKLVENGLARKSGKGVYVAL